MQELQSFIQPSPLLLLLPELLRLQRSNHSRPSVFPLISEDPARKSIVPHHLLELERFRWVRVFASGPLLDPPDPGGEVQRAEGLPQIRGGRTDLDEHESLAVSSWKNTQIQLFYQMKI